MKAKTCCSLLALALTACLCGSASADEFHYNNVLIGDRASGMGGAYTAISDDATGLYYNPAGVVYSSGKNLSASVNAYYNLSKTYKGVIGDHGWDRKSSALLPNYFGIIQPLGRFKVGFSYAVPDTSREDQSQVFYNLSSSVTRYVINFNNEDYTYNFGPSLAMELSKDFSAGLTLYLHQRNSLMIMNQLVNLSDNTYEWTNEYVEINEKGLRPILGFMWSPAEKLSLGLAISRIFIYDSERRRQVTCSDTVVGQGGCDAFITPTNPVYRTDETVTAKKKYPVQIAAGAAYFPTSNLLLSGDITYFSKVDDAAFGNRQAVVNIALGTEYYLSKAWAVRGGLFTNLANTSKISPDVPNQPEHIDLYGGSMSISRFTRNTSLTLGGNMSKGTGKAQIVSNSTQIQEAEILNWTIFLSSSYTY
jgi:long-subunit fatty acid transport protein